MSLKDYENLNKSLYARDKDENQYWLVMLWPCIENRPNSQMISLHGLGNTSKPSFMYAVLCIQKYELILYNAKRRLHINQIQKHCCLLCTQGHLIHEMKKCSVVLFWIHVCKFLEKTQLSRRI